MFKKRVLVLSLIILSLFNSQPVVAESSVNEVHKVSIEAKTLDPRAKILQAYLAQYNSPLQYHAQDFVDAADQYNLDWKLVAAISGTESTFGKFVPGGTNAGFTSYNAWGWGVYGTQAIYFKSWKDGIFTVSEGLRKNYFNKGLTDPYSINRVYAASTHWAGSTSYFLRDIEKFERHYNSTIGKTENIILSLNTKIAGQSATIQ